MTNSRGAFIVCPHCGTRYVQETTEKRRRGLFGKHVSFEMAAPWQPPQQRYQQSIAPPMPSGPLGPGESQYRPMDILSDVATPVRYAAVWAGEIAVLSGVVYLGIEVSPWLLIGAAPVAAFGVVFALVTRPMLKTGGLDVDGWLKTRTREPEGGAPQEPRSYVVEGRLQKSDRTTLYLKFELEDYKAAMAWHKFCKSVLRGKNFSGQEAKRHGLKPSDWRRVYAAFVAQQWCTAVGPRETSELIGEGRNHIRQFATTPPQRPVD